MENSTGSTKRFERTTNRRLLYVTAKSITEVLYKRYSEYGFPLEYRKEVIPHEDKSTLFICSGMQPLKTKFRDRNGSVDGSIQSCIRTKDLDLVGDGTHLTYFEMVGNFSFDGISYSKSLEMWSKIVQDLGLKITHVTYYPTRLDHKDQIESLGWRPEPSEECTWSDGDIGGNCCEFFVGDLEVGNLVNPMGHSTDVGFGLERMLMLVEGKQRVDETSIFEQSFSPKFKDHHRTLTCLWENGVNPGQKNREYICRRLLRRVLDEVPDGVVYMPWVIKEREMRTSIIIKACRCWKKFKDRTPQFWWETFGVLPDELHLIRK